MHCWATIATSQHEDRVQVKLVGGAELRLLQEKAVQVALEPALGGAVRVCLDLFLHLEQHIAIPARAQQLSADLKDLKSSSRG